MIEEKWYIVFGRFLKEYRFTGLLFLLFSCIFTAIFSLYELELEAVWYSVLLCLLAAIPILGIRFHFYYKLHQERQKICNSIEFSFEQLPTAFTLAEQDYQQMVKLLGKKNAEHLTEWESNKQESLDYYTTWVHQIKTPISVMQMILQGEDTKEHRELSAELFRIEQYVEMVLTYLRLGSETTDFMFKQQPLDPIIKQAIHKYAPQFIRKRIRLRYESTDLTVLTDEKWLLFIIEQILSNAIKYTMQGEITITVTKEKVLQIQDTGIGIAAEDLPRIFEKGFTGYNGRSDKKSTGLGLYLCKQAAKKLSITINAESVPKQGTMFYINLHTDKLEVE
ncbi:MAG: sensor histidine kinase [bacterium]|nr:sensor histidine kinase [bacterium]